MKYAWVCASLMWTISLMYGSLKWWKAPCLGEPRNWTVVHRIWIWMHASRLPWLSGTWLSVSAAQAYSEPVGTGFSAPFLSRSPLFQRWLMPDLREGCSLVSAQFSPTYRGRAFSQRAMSEQCSFTLGQKEKQARSRTEDMEPLPDPFDWQPIQGAERWSWIRWQEARAEKALCLQTYCQKCHGYNWNTSIVINTNKSLAPAIQKEQKSRPGGSEGEETIKGGNTITTLALPSSLPLHLLLLCPFFFSLCYSICSSLPIFLYAIEGKPLICTRAFALVLEAEVEQDCLLSSFFPQLVPVASVEFQIVIQWTSA